jgi:undecaprenyl-diphosphatase
VYQAIATVPTPALDVAFRRLSRAADKSKLWLAIAACLAVVGGPTGRRAAARGVLSIGATSAFVNLGVKSLWPRRRPDRAGAGVPDERQVKMPGDVVPVGHSASAFAFATVGHDLPALALGLSFLAAAVASRGSTPASTIPATPSSARSSAPAPPPASAIMDRFTGS